MRYSIEKQGEVEVARILDHMWGLIEDYQLKEDISALVGDGSRKFAVDFAPTISVNSIGIGIIVASFVSIRHGGGKLRISGMGERVRAAFDVTGVSGILDIYDTLEEALAAFDA
jgi:anti-sigma B factor antagonist